MEIDDIVLLVYDIEAAAIAAKKEEDSSKAIRYFYPLNYDDQKKFYLCGSLVTMFQGIEKLTGAAPTLMSLKTFKFEILKTENNFVVALGSQITEGKNLRKELDTLIEVIRLRYSSMAAMLERWQKLKIQDDLVGVLQLIKAMSKLQVSFDIQMKSFLLIENFAKQGSFCGLCLFYGEKSVYSQLAPELTLNLWLARFCVDESNATEFTDHLILRHFPVFIKHKVLKRLRFLNNLKIRKEHSLKQKARSTKHFISTSQHLRGSSSTLEASPSIDEKKNENAEEENFSKTILLVVQANETLLLVLTDNKNFDLNLFKSWEKPLLQLDEQLEAKVSPSNISKDL